MNNNDSLYIYPTDTVWGIGGSIFSLKAFESIAAIKGTSDHKPLSILFSSLNMLEQYFDLSPLSKSIKNFEPTWLAQFFKHEASLGIPVHWVKQAIPQWIYQQSSHVVVRCLSFAWVDQMIKELGAPITTTSLNKTSQPPITDFKAAQAFYLQYATSAKFVSGDEQTTLSGHSSSIVLIDDRKPELTFQLLRRGAHAQFLERHLGLSPA